MRTGLQTLRFSQVAPCAGRGHGDIVAEDLYRHHDHGLALCGIDLSRHDGTAGFVLGQSQLAESGPRTRPEPSDVVDAIFARLAASVRMAPWAKTSASWAANAASSFGAGTKGLPVSAEIAIASPLAEFWMRC